MSNPVQKKQTAANNKLLRDVKRKMNSKVYAHTIDILNSEGEDKAREFLQQFFCVSVNTIFPR